MPCRHSSSSETERKKNLGNLANQRAPRKFHKPWLIESTPWKVKVSRDSLLGNNAGGGLIQGIFETCNYHKHLF